MSTVNTGTLKKIKKVVKAFTPYGIVRIAQKKRTVLSAHTYANKYAEYRSQERVRDNCILYESYNGVGMIGNPWAIFKAFCCRDDFDSYKHIWVIREHDELIRLRKEYRKLRNVRFILYGSHAYSYYLATSHYLINNVSFPGFFSIRSEQHYLNTWHSITVKKIGYDIPDGNRIATNLVRNFLMTDYIISPNAFMTEIFNQSFKLKELYDGRFIEQGFPRNDLVTQTDRKTIVKKLSDRGIRIQPNKKIILYAPTWNGTRGEITSDDTPKYDALSDYLSSRIDMSQYQILIKPHQYIYKKLSPEQLNSNRYIPATVCTNELLSLVDILITDYSSIYFDFLAGVDKPILFYIPDYEQYRKTRGLCFTLDELPGPCTGNLENLAQWINSVDEISDQYATIRQKTKAWACKYDDGHAAERVLRVFIDRNESSAHVLPAQKTEKKKLLFYPGSLASNGVTSSMLNLLNSIDYDRYDVSVFTLDIISEEQNMNFNRIPLQARVFLRVGGPSFGFGEESVYKETVSTGLLTFEQKKETRKYLMEREYCRCFGKAKFDSIIDFSGYSAFFPMLTLVGKPADYSTSFFIWQHTDFNSDFSSEEKARINNRNWSLESLLSVYPLCDKIVSCGEALSKLNIQSTSTDKTRSKFTFVTNLMDSERAKKGLNQKEPFEIPGYYVLDKPTCDSQKRTDTLDIRLIPFPEHAIHFVTVGRLMPEKNHRNLIKAMKMLIDSGTDAYLYIVGDGALKEELHNLIDQLALSGHVILTGMLSNPFSFLKQCSCFVFPSYYEGQPMTVTEARIAGLPIIMSPFATAESVMLENGQYVLKGMEPEDILEGLQAFTTGNVPANYHFTVDEYNQKSLSEWEKLMSYTPQQNH